jgi:hypothetical protein
MSNIRNGKEQYIHTLNGTKWYQQFHDKFTEKNLNFEPISQSESHHFKVAPPGRAARLPWCFAGEELRLFLDFNSFHASAPRKKKLFEDVDTDFEGIRVRLTSHFCDVLRFVHPPVCMSSEGIKQLPILPLSEEKPTL